MKLLKTYNLFLEINRNEIVIDNISNDDIELCKNIVGKQFETHMSYDETIQYLDDTVDWSISKVAKNLENDIMGCLLLGHSIIEKLMKEESWIQILNVDISGKGLEGVALVVLEEYRNSFVIQKLLYSLKDMDYDFITIQQYNTLENSMNYLTKTEKIGEFKEDEHNISVYYKKL